MMTDRDDKGHDYLRLEISPGGRRGTSVLVVRQQPWHS